MPTAFLKKRAVYLHGQNAGSFTFCVPHLIRTSNNFTTAPTLHQASGIKRVLKIAVEVNNFLFDSDKQPESLPPGSVVP